MSQSGGSYIGVYNQLMSIGKALRKNKTKGLDQAGEDLKDLLQSVKLDSMHDESPSSRVGEAQVMMAQAVTQRMQGLKQAEAYSYLAASSIWLEVERERRDANYPSTDEALSKGVLCGAIACGILLSQKPNPLTSPASKRLGVNPIPLPHSRHLTKCWSICFQLANALYYDFGCVEMSTDFYEMASQVITRPPTSTSSSGSGSGNPQQAGHIPNTSGVGGGGAPVSSGMSVSGRSQATAATGGGAAPSITAAKASNTSKNIFASAMERHSTATTTTGGGHDPSSPTGSSRPGTFVGSHTTGGHTSAAPAVTGGTRDPSTTGASDRSGAGSTDEGPSAGSDRPMSGRPGTGGAGGGGAGPQVGGETAISAGTHHVGSRHTTTFLTSGHFHLYLLSTHKAILNACVLKDYPRARTLADDLMLQWRTVQAIRKGTGRYASAAASHPLDGGALPSEGATDDIFRQMSSSAAFADPGSIQSATSGGVVPSTEAFKPTESPVTLPPASGSTTPPPTTDGTASSAAGGGAPQPQDNADTMSETPTAAHGTTANPSLAGTQRTFTNVAAGAVFGAGLAPRKVPAPSSSSQLLAALIEEEEVLVHVHLVRFFLPLLLKESPVVAKRAVQELQDFAELYRELEKKSLSWRRRLEGLELLRILQQKQQNQTSHSGSNNGNLQSSSSLSAAIGMNHRVATFADSLDIVTGTLEIILECYETYATSPAPGIVEEILESAVEDLSRLLSTGQQGGSSSGAADEAAGAVAAPSVVGLGHRCRELNILFTRTKEQITTIPYDLIQEAPPVASSTVGGGGKN